MNRHQRRKRALAYSKARERAAIVRDNLSRPADFFRERGRQVSAVYDGDIGRARGTGAAPMSHKVSAVIARRPEVARLLYPAGTKVVRER